MQPQQNQSFQCWTSNLENQIQMEQHKHWIKKHRFLITPASDVRSINTPPLPSPPMYTVPAVDVVEVGVSAESWQRRASAQCREIHILQGCSLWPALTPQSGILLIVQVSETEATGLKRSWTRGGGDNG